MVEEEEVMSTLRGITGDCMMIDTENLTRLTSHCIVLLSLHRTISAQCPAVHYFTSQHIMAKCMTSHWVTVQSLTVVHQAAVALHAMRCTCLQNTSGG